MCLEKDCVEKLLQTLERFPTSAEILEEASRTLSNLCQTNHPPNWGKIIPALPMLYKCISEVHSQTALLASISSIAGMIFFDYCSQIAIEDNPQAVIDYGCLPFLMNHL